MQKYHQNDIRRTVPEGLRPTAQRKGQTNEKTQAKYGGTGVRQSDPVLRSEENRRIWQGRGAQGHAHGRDCLQPEKVPQEGGRKPSISILRAIMDVLQGHLTAFYRQIQPRPVLIKTPQKRPAQLKIPSKDHFRNSHELFFELHLISKVQIRVFPQN